MTTRHFIPPVQTAIRSVAIAVVVLACVACGVKWADAVHEARAARERVCRAELRALRARNPMIERFVTPQEPCMALSIVTTEDR